MVLYARALIMMRLLTPEWWLNGEGKYEIFSTDVKIIHSLMSSADRWTMTWPLSVATDTTGKTVFELLRISLEHESHGRVAIDRGTNAI